MVRKLVRFAVVLCVLAGVFVAVAGGCKGRSPMEGSLPAESASLPTGYAVETSNPSKPHVAEINISSGLREVAQAGFFGAGGKRSYADLLDFLTSVERGYEPQVKGLLIVFGGMRPEFAHVQELTRVLGRVRTRGVPVVCHGDTFGNGSYWLSSVGCDHIVLSPGGEVETVGIAGQTIYARRLLSELRVDVDMLQVGKFKGASEPFTRDGPSDEARESLMQTLTSIRDQWLGAVSTARDGVGGSVEFGPYSPKESLGLGMVDSVGFVDQAREEAKRRANVGQVVRRYGHGARGAGGSGFVALVRALSGAGVMSGQPHVAVLRAVGAITMGSGGSVFSDSDGISERELSVALMRLGRDDSVRAVVLRIDSPGGSALASDLLWHQVMQLRRVKPVIVSIGGMAASGGYYIACAGTRVYAEPSSIVGSIGVFGGKFSVVRGLDHIGVTAETFAASDEPGAAARAAYLSPFASWDDATRARVSVLMDGVYDLFLERVSEGRSLDADRVSGFAEGRIFAGREGIGLGMVDELGGLQDAVAYALEVSGLGSKGPVHLIEGSTGFGRMFQWDGEDDDMFGGAAVSPQREVFQSVTSSFAPSLISAGGSDSFQSLGILPFVEAWMPMVRGERTLVAVPFAILIR
ncbi:MAG: S49 family peptidase [Polyangiaceae bacterium]|nr:S49 family peptidase [Polyangiaceae bacterium]